LQAVEKYNGVENFRDGSEPTVELKIRRASALGGSTPPPGTMISLAGSNESLARNFGRDTEPASNPKQKKGHRARGVPTYQQLDLLILVE